jgi:hypothetical protein
MSNQISAVLSEENVTDIKKKISDIRTILTFMVNASSSDHLSNQNMGQGGLGFGKSALKAVRTHPEIIPPALSEVEFNKSIDLYDQIQLIMSDIATLNQHLESTNIIIGQDIMKQANHTYDLVKNAAQKEVKYKPTYDELAVYYKNRGPKKKIKNT